MDGGIEDVFVRRPGVMECPDPVTIGHARYTRDERMVDGERGTCKVCVHVCRDTDAEARDAAECCERALKQGSWERYGEDAVVSVDASAPEFKERDSSGRYVYELEVVLVVDRSLP